MVKIDMKDAFFHVRLAKESRHLASFQWMGRSYEFRAMCFGLGPAPRIFTKLGKVPIAILRLWGIRLIIYLDDIIVFAKSKAELCEARDLTISLLTRLGFTINSAKSILTPVQKLVYLGIAIDSVNMTFELPPEKTEELIALCNEIILKNL